jgi:hypothetical protein
MWIHCLIRREGATVFTLDKEKYTFMPIPGSRRGEMVTSVADVTNEAHIQYLLRRKQFVSYDEYGDEAADELKALRETKNPMQGFSVEKFGSGEHAGYIAADRRNKVVLFAGTAGDWKKDTAGVAPFNTEMDAFQFLQAEAEYAEESEASPPPAKEKTARA